MERPRLSSLAGLVVILDASSTEAFELARWFNCWDPDLVVTELGPFTLFKNKPLGFFSPGVNCDYPLDSLGPVFLLIA
jgi:hypothetical protein